MMSGEDLSVERSSPAPPLQRLLCGWGISYFPWQGSKKYPSTRVLESNYGLASRKAIPARQTCFAVLLAGCH